MIEIERGDVWTLTINRPEKANSLTREMLTDLADAVEEAATAAPAALILTGVGKVFSAGADLDAAKAGLAVDPVWERLSGAIAALPFLTIAALNGTLAGGAFGMALACDVRVCVPTAKFFYPVMALGFLPQPSDPGRMTKLMGPARASMILAAGQKITADAAIEWGLVDRICDDPLATAMELTQASAKASPHHRAAIKSLIVNG